MYFTHQSTVGRNTFRSYLNHFTHFACLCHTHRGILEARGAYSILATMLVGTALSYWRGATSSKPVTAPRRRQGDMRKDTKPPPAGTNRTMLLAHVQLMWTLVMVLLLRPHNTPLVFLITLMEAGLERALHPAHSVPTWAVTLLYLWMGQASFFYQVRYNRLMIAGSPIWMAFICILARIPGWSTDF